MLIAPEQHLKVNTKKQLECDRNYSKIGHESTSVRICVKIIDLANNKVFVLNPAGKKYIKFFGKIAKLLLQTEGNLPAFNFYPKTLKKSLK